nr:flavonoid 3',5'-hydroxylase [synthetic construct]
MSIDITILLCELVAAISLYLLTYYFICFLFKPSHHHHHLPPGPTGWPIIGSLPLLGTMPHVSLADMAVKYGPIMYLKLGSKGTVVASNPKAARAFLKSHDANFSNRPIDGGPTYLAYNAQDMVFAEYGPKWKLLRKLCSLHMLGPKALEDWAHVRVSEVGHMLKEMYEQSSKSVPVVVPEMLTYAMANMIGRIILSRRPFVITSKLDSSASAASVSEFQYMVMELMRMAGLFNIGDFIPYIAWMDLQGIQRDMKVIQQKFDVLLNKMIKEHTESAHDRKDNPDFLDILMAATQENTEGIQLNLVNVKALLLDLFTAGTDTSSSVIEWALAEMLNNRQILNRAHEEMDQVIGRNRRLEQSDIPNLPYFQAICKETFRKHPSTPLNLPRISTEECEVEGFRIPKNTRLIVNIWAIGRDPKVWENPLDFTPERFLSEKHAKIDPRGNHFELIPFGAGRRICAGARMGAASVEYILGTLVHSFDWKLPDGVVEVNMEESFGIALQKKMPLSAIVTPRLPPSAYTV